MCLLQLSQYLIHKSVPSMSEERRGKKKRIGGKAKGKEGKKLSRKDGKGWWRKGVRRERKTKGRNKYFSFLILSNCIRDAYCHFHSYNEDIWGLLEKTYRQIISSINSCLLAPPETSVLFIFLFVCGQYHLPFPPISVSYFAFFLAHFLLTIET